MKKYIILAIAALSMLGQSTQCSEAAKAIVDEATQMWQWDHMFRLAETIEDLQEQIGFLTVLNAPASETDPLVKAVEALQTDRYESAQEVFNVLLKRPTPTVSMEKFAFSGVGVVAGLGLLYRGLAKAYNAYYDENCTSKKRTIAGNLSLAACGAAMVGLLAPVVFEGFKG